MFLVTTVATANAAPICDPDDATSCLQVLREGVPAPFPGILSTYTRAARITVQLEQAGPRQAAEVRLVRGELQAEIDRLSSRLDLREEYHRKEIDLVTAQAKQAVEDARGEWYERPLVVAALAVVATVAVFAVTSK